MYSASIFLLLEAGRLVFSSCEAHLMNERTRKKAEMPAFSAKNDEGRPDILTRLCVVVDWCIDHPEYTAKIKVIPKKDYPILMPCEL